MKKKKIRRLITVLCCLVVLCCLSAFGFSMKPVSYVSAQISSESVNVVFISDLHNCFYGGTDQSGLWEAVNASRPDIVIFGGDVIDAWGGTEYALRIMKMANEKYPCVYTPGNHESMRDDMEEFFSKQKTLVSLYFSAIKPNLM